MWRSWVFADTRDVLGRALCLITEAVPDNSKSLVFNSCVAKEPDRQNDSFLKALVELCCFREAVYLAGESNQCIPAGDISDLAEY